MVFESYGIVFFRVFISFCHSYLDLSMIFMLNYAFTHILFNFILLFAVEMSDRQAFWSQARQMAVTDPI